MHQWSTTPLNNQTADSRANWQEGQPASSLNNSARGLMSTAAFWRDDNLGILVATLGAGNVYTVTTGQGLIDPASTAGGGTAKISHPFSLRVVLPAMNTAVATTAPTIVVDGAAAVPLLRRDGTAPADKDLNGIPYEILGDQVTGGAYSRARILDALPSDAATAGGGPVFGGRLVCTGPTELRLMPDESNQFFVNGKSVTIPTVGIPISNAGLSGVGDIYPYLDATGALSFDGPSVVSPTYGHQVDPTTKLKSLVGYSRCGFASASQFSPAGTLSRYCKRDRVTMGPVFFASLGTSLAWLPGSYTPFVCWPDEDVDMSWYGWDYQASQATGLYNYTYLGYDNSIYLTNPNQSGGAAFQNSGDGSRWGGALTRGLHTAMVAAYSNVAGSGVNGQVIVKTRG